MRQARILVVEDDPTNQAVALAQLAKLGSTADTVRTGVEAIHALDTKKYDLILMDCEMPGMDGYEATRRIRASGNSSIPIIALTADAMRGHRDQCLLAGMNDYLSKPVELQPLGKMLLKWLRATGAKETIQDTAVTTGEAAPVFDEHNLLGRLMNDRELAGTIITVFLEDCPAQLALLSERISETDAPGTRRQAHKIKGAAASVSAVSLRAVALEMERAAGAGDLDSAGALLPRATEEFERLKVALQAVGWLDRDLNPEFHYENTDR